ncbi:aminoglycoside phosphotransferase [Dietzia natronolimnaea]|uniref:Aminoglycoside phosphotransferase n=1 Tax=Dietzia natronolimnaea TaxID=161920 RepID=A0A2A2WM17_9ACTN|nr:aminoglycoside phosphotransferase family protein [Dietzia natronolimnaea]PAY22221.1 aminoglycoside phosphotransferase [Dietzia natronolimnaea]
MPVDPDPPSDPVSPADAVSPDHAVSPADRSTALDAIRAAFPALLWESAQWIDEGWDHVVVMLHECRGADSLGHRDLVFRFPMDEQALAQLPHEVAVLEHLSAGVDAAIPLYSHVPPDGGFAGYPLVCGDRLTPDLLRSLPTTDRTMIAGQLGSLLAALHGADTSGPPLDRVPDSYQPENLDFVRGIVANDLSAVFTEDEMRTAREICDEVAALQSTLLPRVLLHNDVYVRHLYWDRRTSPGRLGLIDFTDMCLGDPAVDFAELYEYGPRFVDEVLARYVGRIDETFLDRAWTYQRFAGLYMVVGHLYYGEETWEYARATFDRCRSPRRPLD